MSLPENHYFLVSVLLDCLIALFFFPGCDENRYRRNSSEARPMLVARLLVGLGSVSQYVSSGLCVCICYSGNYATFW